MKMIYFEWADATGQAGWMDRETQRSFDWNPMLIKSIGILVREDKDSVTICHSLSEHDHINGYITVPKGWIKKRKTVKV